MKNLIQNEDYKGYYGTAEFSSEDEVFYGKIAFIRSLILYQAENSKELKQAFYAAVDDYLEDCKNDGVEPEKPCKGSFNVRIGEELHCQAALLSLKMDEKLNEFVTEAVKERIEKIKKEKKIA